MNAPSVNHRLAAAVTDAVPSQSQETPPVNFTSLSALTNPSPESAARIASLISNQGTERARKRAVAKAIVQFFADNGRSEFSMADAIALIREVGLESHFVPRDASGRARHSAGTNLNIQLGQLFGVSYLNLEREGSNSNLCYRVAKAP